MPKGINKAIIVGHTGSNPDVRQTSNTTIAKFLIATSDFKGERTEWHRIVLFGKLAEVAAQYVHKGDVVYIEGRIQTHKWEDKDGNTRYTTEIIGNELQMLGGKKREPVEERQPMVSNKQYDDDIPF